MHSLAATTSSNPLNASMKIFVMGDILLGSYVTSVVVVELLFPIHITTCDGGFIKFLLCSFLLYTSYAIS